MTEATIIGFSSIAVLVVINIVFAALQWGSLRNQVAVNTGRIAALEKKLNGTDIHQVCLDVGDLSDRVIKLEVEVGKESK
jgi:hypothetical protein